MPLLDFDTRDNIRKRQSQAFRARATQAAQRQAEARRRILAQKDAKLFRKEATALTQQVTQRRTDSQGFRADAQKLVSQMGRQAERDRGGERVAAEGMEKSRLLRQFQGAYPDTQIASEERQRILSSPLESVRRVVQSPSANLADIGNIDIGSPHYGPEGAPLPVTGNIPGLRTLPEAAATIGTAGLGTLPITSKVGGLVGALGGGYGGREAGEQIGGDTGALVGEVAGTLGGGLVGGIAGPRLARGIAHDMRARPGGLASEVGGSRLGPDDAPMSNTPEDPIQKMTTWLNESKGALVKGRQDRRAQVATLRKQQAAALGEAYDNPNLTPREQFETGTKNMAGTAGTTGTGPPPINEEEVGSLLTKIRDFPIWQNRKFKARNAQSGLLKLMGGELPDQSELKLLEQVFGPDFVKAASSADSNAWREVGAALALPRTGRTMLDMSWLWRQGVGVHARHPEVYKNAAIGARALVDPNFARQWDEAVRMKPGIVKLVGDDGVDATWTVGELQDEVDLFLPKLEDVTGDLAERTEEFTATSGRDTWVGKMTNWAASPFSRNFIGTGNASRSDIFENTISSPLYKMGGKVTMNDARALAWLTNVATGRGDLYGANRYGALLAQPVFSPRLFAARLQHAASPAMLATGIGAPRSLKTAALAAQQLTTFIGSGIAIAAIASQVPGLRSEQNPLSSKWGKIEIGFDPLHPKKETTKVDLFGGYQQYARTIANLYAAKAKSDTGEIYEKDRWSIFEQFARNKASPNAGMIWDVLSGEYGVGNQKVDLKTAAGIRTFLWNELSPLSFNDIVESVNRDDGFKPQYGVLAPLSTGGMGVQTYGGDTSPGATIYDIQEFKGIPADMQYDITGKEGFFDRVAQARNPEVPLEKMPKMSESIIELGEAEGQSREFIQAALYLNSDKWQKENRTDEWYDFVIDNEDALRESNSDMFSQWLNKFLDLNRDRRVKE